jgi:hypothetical protein
MGWVGVVACEFVVGGVPSSSMREMINGIIDRYLLCHLSVLAGAGT